MDDKAKEDKDRDCCARMFALAVVACCVALLGSCWISETQHTERVRLVAPAMKHVSGGIGGDDVNVLVPKKEKPE